MSKPEPLDLMYGGLEVAIQRLGVGEFPPADEDELVYISGRFDYVLESRQSCPEPDDEAIWQRQILVKSGSGDGATWVKMNGVPGRTVGDIVGRRDFLVVVRMNPVQGFSRRRYVIYRPVAE